MKGNKMIIDNNIMFNLHKRKNVHSKNGDEWALNVHFGIAGMGWNITTWNKKPTDDEVSDMKEIFIRSCEIYHKHLFIPNFGLKENKK